MRILYIHQYFCTRAGRSGTRSYEFARRLVERGHRVTMLTSTFDLSDIQIAPGGSIGRRTIDGIDVIAARVGYSQQMGTAGRVWSFLRFMAVSSWLACRERGHDVVLATSTPLSVGVPGLLASLVHRIPMVFEVRDLWPEAPIQIGIIRNPFIIAALRAFERFVYRRSTHVIALSPGMRDGVVAAGTPPSKVSVIPNCSDLDLFQPGEASFDVLYRYDLRGRFVVAHAGAMGDTNDLHLAVDAAVILQETAPSVRLLLIGQGKQAAELRRRVEELRLQNVVFTGSVPRQQVAELLQASHVCLVLVKNVPVLATTSCNKFFDALAAGRPVLVNIGGWMRDLVERHDAGVCATPGSAQSLAEQIRILLADPDRCAALGRNARRLAENEFDRDKLARQFEAVLCEAAGVTPAEWDDSARTRDGETPRNLARDSADRAHSAGPRSASGGRRGATETGDVGAEATTTR